MRKLLMAVSLMTLAACGLGQSTAPESTLLAMPSLVGWNDVVAEDINVPAGATFSAVEVEGTRVMEISGVGPAAPSAAKTGGVSVRMSDDFENQVSGNTVLVTVRAYSEQAGGRLGLAYSTNDVGNSGWRDFALTTTPADYSFTYDVPAKQAGLGDFLGFRSYDNQTVRVVGFQTTVIPRRAAAAPSDAALRTTQGE
ncbi:MAG: hypothetical protein R3C30_00925 [Hyphomonadaceae bacterium]